MVTAILLSFAAGVVIGAGMGGMFGFIFGFDMASGRWGRETPPAGQETIHTEAKAP